MTRKILLQHLNIIQHEKCKWSLLSGHSAEVYGSILVIARHVTLEGVTGLAEAQAEAALVAARAGKVTRLHVQAHGGDVTAGLAAQLAVVFGPRALRAVLARQRVQARVAI
jgi:hypothetical protein